MSSWQVESANDARTLNLPIGRYKIRNPMQLPSQNATTPLASLLPAAAEGPQARRSIEALLSDLPPKRERGRPRKDPLLIQRAAAAKANALARRQQIKHSRRGRGGNSSSSRITFSVCGA